MAPLRDVVAGFISLAGVVAAISVFVTYRRYASASRA
jgi:hypothetical protein